MNPSWPASTSAGCSISTPRASRLQLYRPSSEPGSGYRGRTGIYELIAVDDHMRTMIHDGASEQDLERYARANGESWHP